MSDAQSRGSLPHAGEVIEAAEGVVKPIDPEHA